MKSGLDFSRIVATENSWLITSMSTAAGFFSEKGLLPGSALTDFRINVSGLQGSQQVCSMVEGLDRGQDALFHYLCHILGRDQVVSSVWLQFATRLSNHLIELLTKSQIRLLELGKKHFNRHVSLSNDDVCLVSELVLDFNSLTRAGIETLSQEGVILYLSHDLPPEISGGEISQIFGLSTLSTNLAKFHADQLINSRFQAIESLFKGFLTIENALSQSQASAYHSAGHAVSPQNGKNLNQSGMTQSHGGYADSILALQLKALAHCLSRVPETIHFTKSMERATELLNLSLSMGEDVMSEIFKKLDEKFVYAAPDDVPLKLRRVQSHLIQAGHKPEEAREATRCLRNYLNQHEISLSELLTSEGERIHPSLGPLTIDHLKTDPLRDGSDIKDKAQKNFSETLGKLTELITKTTHFLVILFFVASCGVKGSLKSVAEPLRPIVPPMGDSHAAPK